jgi:SAM-dependent methyltransferase
VPEADVSVRSELEAVIARVGPWTAHNVEVAPRVFTMPQRGAEPNSRFGQIVQVVADVVGTADLSGVRIVDLGCLEGGFAIELALHGAEVVGVEGREAAVVRGRFAAGALGLDRCSFVQDDVRNFSLERYGCFDIVLCLGLLYHLELEDGLALLRAMRGVCRRALVLDTHVSLTGRQRIVSGGRTYRGHRYVEHASGDGAEVIRSREWASLGNVSSFWLTRPSLYDALAESGFSTVLEAHLPQPAGELRADRVQLVAFAGERIDVRTVARPAGTPAPYRPPSRTGDQHALDEAVSLLAAVLLRRARNLWRALVRRGRGALGRVARRPG